LTLNSKPMS